MRKATSLVDLWVQKREINVLELTERRLERIVLERRSRRAKKVKLLGQKVD